MKLVEAQRDWLIKRAKQGAPYEVCGFILGDGSVVEIPNVATDPTKTFAMDREHLVTKVPDPKAVVALWHSHPDGRQAPSDTDLRCAQVFPGWIFIIVTSEGLYPYGT
jgi:proteasome lid subunit RPN8/RPN11